jgi:glycosyltransferase involved in cell wall biosynthesis
MRYALPDRPSVLGADEFVRFGFGEGLRPSYVFELRRLEKYLKQHREEISLVHFYSTNLVLLGPRVAARAGVPSLLTVTGFGRVFTSRSAWYRGLRPVYWRLFHSSLDRARRVLVQNQADQERLQKRFPRCSHKVVYAGSAVSTPSLLEKGFDSPRLTVLHVARLMPDKGIVEFLRLAERFASHPVTFRLVGPPSVGFPDLHREVMEVSARGIVDYLGELTPSETLQEMVRSHVLYFPSHGEGMPRVMLEGAAKLLFPLATDIDAHRDLVKPGGGILVPVGDIETPAHALAELLADRSRLQREAEAFRDHVLHHFSMEAYTSRVDAVYSAVLEEVRQR